MGAIAVMKDKTRKKTALSVPYVANINNWSRVRNRIALPVHQMHCFCSPFFALFSARIYVRTHSRRNGRTRQIHQETVLFREQICNIQTSKYIFRNETCFLPHSFDSLTSFRGSYIVYFFNWFHHLIEEERMHACESCTIAAMIVDRHTFIRIRVTTFKVPYGNSTKRTVSSSTPHKRIYAY